MHKRVRLEHVLSVGAVAGLLGVSSLALAPPTVWAEASKPAACEDCQCPPQSEATQTVTWSSFVTGADLVAEVGPDGSRNGGLVLIDVRSPDAYAAGHLPGAISLPGDLWRTPSARPGEGDSQYLFRDPANDPDIARYESLLGGAGLTRDADVVVYGEHAGRADGSVPAMILDWLGQQRVRFLDGVGVQQWQSAGGELVTEPVRLAAATYDAEPRDGLVWNLDDVLAHVGREEVVFYDTRSEGEYAGSPDPKDRRGNRFGGHIPGAVLLDYASFLADNKTVLSPAELKAELVENGVTPDKTVVLYCQTATRVSLPYLVLKDLGYDDVVVYDGSWHEYGNRDDTPKATDVAPAPAPAPTLDIGAR